MTTTADTPVTTTTDQMRELLAFGLATADNLGIALEHIKVGRGGNELELWVDDYDDRTSVRRLAEAVGVTDPLVNDVPGSTYAMRSRGQWFPWEQARIDAGEPYPHTGASVPFGDRMIEVSVICSLSRLPE